MATFTATKYCRPGLSTGLNDGTSWENAWQSFADMDAGMSAGDTIGIPYGTYTGSTLNITKSGTAYNNRITIVACDVDGSALTLYDIIVLEKDVFIDGQSSLTNLGTIDAATFVSLIGISGSNATSHGWDFKTANSPEIAFIACRIGSCGGGAINGISYLQYGVILYCKFFNIGAGTQAVGSNGGMRVMFNLFKNIAAPAYVGRRYDSFVGNVIDDCGSANDAVFFQNIANHCANNVFYNCSGRSCIAIENVVNTVQYNKFAVCDNSVGAITLGSSASLGISIIGNAYYDVTTKYSVLGSIGFLAHEIDMTSHGMIDPANGNYMSDPATDEARNIEYPIDSINSVFITTGIQPEEASTGPKITSADFGKTAGETINITIENQTSASDSLSLTNVDTSADYSMTIDSRNGDVVTSTIPLGITIGNYELIYTDSNSNTAEYGYVIEGTMPSPDDVRIGIDVNDTVGNLTIPSIDNVENGISFGTSGTEFTGSLTLPTSADVRQSSQYGTSGTEFTGSLVVPSEDDVRDGISVDDTTGNLTLPIEAFVKNGETYGTSGTEFTGTLEARNPITIDSYSTTSGYISGSDEIVLSGTFGSEGDVYFGCNLWENQYWSSTVISGTTPSVDEAQTVKVFVINGDNVAVNFDFTYNENPTVDTYTSYSSLPDSDYFKKCTTNYNSERQLYDLLVTEAYNKTGTCMTYYVTDYDTTKDKLFGEDTDRTVLRSFDIMAHGELPREEQLWSKFGIEGLDNFQIFVAKRHFTAASSQDSYDATVPRIGDMIYMDHNNRTYDVIDVGQEEEMFLQGKHTWIITLSPHQDTHIALSADTSATMGDISAATDQTTDEYDISSYIENEVSAVEFDTSGDSGDAPSTVWGDW